MCLLFSFYFFYRSNFNILLLIILLPHYRYFKKSSVPVVGVYFSILSSILSKDITVTKYQSITDKKSRVNFQFVCNVFVSFLMSLDNCEPSYLWSNLSNNNDSKLCFNYFVSSSKIRHVVVNRKMYIHIPKRQLESMYRRTYINPNPNQNNIDIETSKVLLLSKIDISRKNPSFLRIGESSINYVSINFGLKITIIY